MPTENQHNSKVIKPVWCGCVTRKQTMQHKHGRKATHNKQMQRTRMQSHVKQHQLEQCKAKPITTMRSEAMQRERVVKQCKAKATQFKYMPNNAKNINRSMHLHIKRYKGLQRLVESEDKSCKTTFPKMSTGQPNLYIREKPFRQLDHRNDQQVVTNN